MELFIRCRYFNWYICISLRLQKVRERERERRECRNGCTVEMVCLSVVSLSVIRDTMVRSSLFVTLFLSRALFSALSRRISPLSGYPFYATGARMSRLSFSLPFFSSSRFYFLHSRQNPSLSRLGWPSQRNFTEAVRFARRSLKYLVGISASGEQYPGSFFSISLYPSAFIFLPSFLALHFHAWILINPPIEICFIILYMYIHV